MISGIVNKIKDGIKGSDSSITGHSWKSPWSIARVMYWVPKYLIYHPIRLTAKGFPYIVNLKQTWKQNIRPKIPFGDPDVHSDVKENETTYKDYGVRFDPIMKKKDHGEDVRVKAPKYKLPQRSMQQFEAWLESSEEDKKNENFIPKSSDKKKLSNDEQNAYNGLIKLHEFLKKNNGTVKVEGGELVIKIDVADKTLEEIEEQVKHCYDVLDMPHDTKIIEETTAERLYKKAQDRGISSDEPFAKTKQQQTSLSPSKSKGEDVDGETGETIQDATQQDSNLNDIENMEPMKQIPDIRKEEQMSNSVNDEQFSLTDPEKFPTSSVNLQSEKRSSELQSDLISYFEVGGTDINNIKNQVIEVTSKDLRDVSLNATGTKPSCISGSNYRRREEVSRG